MPPFGPPITPAIHCAESTLGYWQGQSVVSGTAIVGHPDAQLGFSRLSWEFGRTTPSSAREDVMTTHMDFVHTDIGVAVPLSTTEKGEIETGVVIAYNGLVNRIPTAYTLADLVWHDYQPISTRPGPADRITTIGSAGTQANSRNADQLSINATYKTASRKHWGRSYFPFASTSAVDTTFGRVQASFCDAVALFVNQCFSLPGAGNGITPCVSSVVYKAVLTVQDVTVDNIFDVIRSRRAKVSTYRKSYQGS